MADLTARLVAAEEAHQEVATAGSEADADTDKDYTPCPATTAAVQPQPLQLSIGQWKVKNTYDPEKMVQLTTLVHRFNLRGRGVQDLLYHTLFLFSDVSVEELKRRLQLPSPSTMQRGHHIAFEGFKQQLRDIVAEQQFGIECDEGPFRRLKYFVILVTLPCNDRYFVGAPHMSTTIAQAQLDTILDTQHENKWEVHNWPWMTSDSAASMLKLAELASEMKQQHEKAAVAADGRLFR